jgi:hypothetical protein
MFAAAADDNPMNPAIAASLQSMDELEPFIGEWAMAATFPNAPTMEDPGARATFEWMPGRQFLIQRWQAPDPAPDGIAVIGLDRGRDTLLQHYFDERGVARLYEMSFADGFWRLERNLPDFSPLDFSQRYVGRFSEDQRMIRGSWEICHDGTTWEHDFELTYTKVN